LDNGAVKRRGSTTPPASAATHRIGASSAHPNDEQYQPIAAYFSAAINPYCQNINLIPDPANP
jgi:hypothetical protein